MRKVLRVNALAAGKEPLLELSLECGHRVRCFDPGFQHLRPTENDCYKCKRGWPPDEVDCA